MSQVYGTSGARNRGAGKGCSQRGVQREGWQRGAQAGALTYGASAGVCRRWHTAHQHVAVAQVPRHVQVGAGPYAFIWRTCGAGSRLQHAAPAAAVVRVWRHTRQSRVVWASVVACQGAAADGRVGGGVQLLGHSRHILRWHPCVTRACDMYLALQLIACINVPVPLQAGPCLPTEPQHATAPHQSEFTVHGCCNSLQVAVGCRAVGVRGSRDTVSGALGPRWLESAVAARCAKFAAWLMLLKAHVSHQPGSQRIRPDTSATLSKRLRAPILTGLGLGGAGLGGGEAGSGTLHSTWQVSPLMLARLRLYMTAPTLTPAAGRGHGQAARMRQWGMFSRVGQRRCQRLSSAGHSINASCCRSPGPSQATAVKRPAHPLTWVDDLPLVIGQVGVVCRGQVGRGQEGASRG